MTAADTAAVKALVEAAGSLAGDVYVTLVPEGVTPAKPYVIVHPAEGEDTTDRVAGPRITTHPEFTLHIVGLTAASVQIVVDLVKAKFVTAGRFIYPVVSGRKGRAGYWRMPLPLQTDRDVTPWLVFAVVELGWESEPST